MSDNAARFCTPSEIRSIREMYLAGIRPRIIIHRTGRSKSAVYRILGQQGLMVRKHDRKPVANQQENSVVMITSLSVPLKDIARRRDFSTGQVAKILGVAPRTVSKWFDSGRLPGYRLPGSNDRRITCKELISFAMEAGWPMEAIVGGTGAMRIVLTDDYNSLALFDSLTASPNGSIFRHCPTVYDFGSALSDCPSPEGVWIDFTVGRIAALDSSKHARQRCPATPIYLLVNDDETEADSLGLIGEVINRDLFMRGVAK